MFYPASTLYALAEETYRLGLYGLCNTDNLRQIYDDDYARQGHVVHARPSTRRSSTPDGRVERTPGATRSRCSSTPGRATGATAGRWRRWRWRSSSDRLGDRVRIVTAGRLGRAGEGGDDGHQAPRPARLPRHRRALPALRRRPGADRVQAPVVPAAGAHGLRRAGRGLRQPLGPLDPARTGRTRCWPSGRWTAWSTSSSGCASTPSCASGCRRSALRRHRRRGTATGSTALAPIYPTCATPRAARLTRRPSGSGGRSSSPREPLGERMAGPAIRALELARALARAGRSARSRWRPGRRRARRPGASRWPAVDGRDAARPGRPTRVSCVVQGDVLGLHPWLADVRRPDRRRRLRPVPPRAAGAGPARWGRPGGGPSSATACGALNRAARPRRPGAGRLGPAAGDCGSVTSAALGRVNPVTYDAAHDLSGLLAVVPVRRARRTPPRAGRPGACSRPRCRAIGPDDDVVALGRRALRLVRPRDR